MVYRQLLGTNTVTSSSTTGSVTFGSAVPVGRLVVLCLVWSNDSTVIPTIDTIADSRGNTYSVNSSAGTANATASCAIVSAPVSTALQSGDSVTVTLSSGRVRWCLQADELGSVGAFDKPASNHNPGSATSMSTGTTAATTYPSEVAVANWGWGRGGGATPTLDTASGWFGSTYVTTAAGSTDRALQVAFRDLTATGTQSGTATLSVAAGYVGALATFTLLQAPVPDSPTRKQLHMRVR